MLLHLVGIDNSGDYGENHYLNFSAKEGAFFGIQIMPKSSKEMKQNTSEQEIVLSLNKEYKTLLNELKNKIRGARLKAALAVNHEVISLYWHIGKQIIERQNWGSKLVETLSKDLRNAFPETSGFSVRNLQRMRQFSANYPNFEILPQAVAQLPWGHISVLIHKVKDDTARCW